MTRDEAIGLIQRFLKLLGVDKSPGLNDKDLGGVKVEDSELYFEYRRSTSVLLCSAFIYRFATKPDEQKLTRILDQIAEQIDTGGGEIDFQPENQGMFLTKLYKQLPEDETFSADMEKLTGAVNLWMNDKVLSLIFANLFPDKA